MKKPFYAVWFVAVLIGCGGGGGGTDTTPGPDALDSGPEAVTDPGPGPDLGDGTDPGPQPDLADPGPGDPGGEDTGSQPVLCLGEVGASKTFTFQGLHGTVEVVRDRFGIPHIYATNDEDLFFAQGFVVAQDRIIQMQGMRLITHGRFAETLAAGASDLNTDVYMRLMNFRAPAEAMWADLQAKRPEVAAVLDAFAKGVTAFIETAKENPGMQPIEWTFLGHWDPWTPVDTLMLGRLQSWDLSFDHYTDEISMAATLQGVFERFHGTPFEGLLLDAYRAAPGADATILEPSRKGKGQPRPALPRALFQEFPKGYFQRLAGLLRGVSMKPTPSLGGGSNNWVVSGDYTESGRAMVAGDPHLSLRNPSVFYQVHLNTTRAGGDLDLTGVCFPGIPGIILGHTQHGAWMATVHDYDVTDVYKEVFAKDDPQAVVFQGENVPLRLRKETLTYNKPAGGCEAWVVGLAQSLAHEVTEEDGRCILTVTIEEVPHHGPIIPGSRATLPDGTQVGLSWRWTGFEPSEDFAAVAGLWRARTTDDFLDTIRLFGVGGQNWVWGGTDGHIAYAAWARVPIRKHVAEGKGYDAPPWLPMPGDGCCEWTGDIPRDDLPHAVDPASGFIATANHDALGTTLDNDPLNDAHYLAQTYDIGFRGARVRELLQAKMPQKKLTIEDFQAIQADHRSPLGALLTPAILLAIAEGQKAVDGAPGSDPRLTAYMNPEVAKAAARLASWDFMTPSGLEDEASEPEKASAVATSIFNAWLVFLFHNVLDNKGLQGLESQFAAKLLLAMILEPSKLATYSPDLGDTVLWDDVSTADTVETRHLVILKSLHQALAFLADPAKVGVAQSGGFGTTDMAQWLWGKLHTVTLPHALGGEANIPPASQYPDGFPRHGDNFVVDSSNPGLNDTRFTYSHGPAMRAVYVLDPGGVRMQNAIPGGQNGAFPNAHYNDDFFLWARNQTHPVYSDMAGVLANAEACLLLKP